MGTFLEGSLLRLGAAVCSAMQIINRRLIFACLRFHSFMPPLDGRRVLGASEAGPSAHFGRGLRQNTGHFTPLPPVSASSSGAFHSRDSLHCRARDQQLLEITRRGRLR